MAVRGIRVSVFDFDGCLFKSPMPSGELWSKEGISKLYRGVKKGGLGWNYSPRIFEETVLQPNELVNKENFVSKWFREEMLSHVQRAIDDNSTKTVLLTGRTEPLRPLLEKIFSFVGLNFDKIILRPSEDITTELHKASAIEELLKEFTEYESVDITVWDDHPGNLSAISTQIERISDQLESTITHEMNHVPSLYSVILKSQEKQLVMSLLSDLQTSINRKKPFVLKTIPTHTGIQLDAQSKQLLQEYALSVVPKEWTIAPKFVLINKGPASKYATLTKQKYEQQSVKISKNTAKHNTSKRKNKGTKEKKEKMDQKAEFFEEFLFPALPYVIGEPIQMKATGFIITDSYLAVSVRGTKRTIDCQHGIPYLIVAVAPSSKLTEGETIQNWTKFTQSKQLNLFGKVKEFGKLSWV